MHTVSPSLAETIAFAIAAADTLGDTVLVHATETTPTASDAADVEPRALAAVTTTRTL